MELTGSRTIAETDRERIWQALNDPDVLQACIPAAKRCRARPRTRFEATVKQKVGRSAQPLKGSVALSNVVPGEATPSAVRARAALAGFAKGGADVSLADAEAGPS
jgi:carbon monoxide dehydrogenase subunit G